MVDISKVTDDNLKKSFVSLEKTIVNLSKETNINLNAHTARVCVVLDYSGSMESMYRSGKVQRVLNRLVPLALKFDDNGELDIILFQNNCKKFPSITLNNYSNYVNEVILRSSYDMGGTNYSPAIYQLIKDYGKPSGIASMFKKGSSDPAFVIFITDGANFDEIETDKAIRESSEENIFIQFVGIGNSSFKYLEKLDDLDGRRCDNTGFIKVKDFEKLSDEEVYKQLLSQYPEWIEAVGL